MFDCCHKCLHVIVQSVYKYLFQGRQNPRLIVAVFVLILIIIVDTRLSDNFKLDGLVLAPQLLDLLGLLAKQLRLGLTDEVGA